MGVWYTEGALDGGLKIMWSTTLPGVGAKEGAGFTRSFLTVRR